MISFTDVSFSYPQANRPALQNITFDISEGEFALLVGPSGCGKSTLLRCINGLVPHFSGGKLSGQLQVNDLNPVSATPKVMSRHVGFVFQDPESQFVVDRVEDEIAFALENSAMPPQEMRVRVEEVLDLLDLAPLRDRPLHTLSGGERQRTAIAAALAFRPKILVLDEPTSQLDPKSAEDVLHALTRLNTDLGLTIVVAEHRMERILPFADTLLALNATGSQIKVGHPLEVLSEIDLTPPLVTLSKALQWQPLPLTIKTGRRQARRWLSTRSVTPPTAQPTTQVAPLAQPYVHGRDIAVSLDGRPTLHNVNIELYPGRITVLMGRNGAGKTTLLRSLIGLIKQRKGRITVDGQDIANRPLTDVTRQIGYLPQDPNALLFAETVKDELLVTLQNHGWIDRHGNTTRPLPVQPEALLQSLGIADKADHYPRDLSVGERQRVALGAILITRPKALLLDEPTRGLDYDAKNNLVALLRRWRDEGMAILVVTHDVELAADLADQVMLVSQGEVIANGPPAEILGASPLFAPQIARLFPETDWLTVEDVLAHADI